MSVPVRHGNYDLEALDEFTVSIVCADPDCLEPLGTSNVKAWGEIAEAHYREKVSVGG